MRSLNSKRPLLAASIALSPLSAMADALAGPTKQQPVNLEAIVMFAVFVLLTLGITYWAARRTKTAKDFYAAGGGITGFQNGLAIAGDFMSAASFLGISALVFDKGYDGLIYSIGFLVGWPIILFLIAERLRNLGKYTFADVAGYRLQRKPVRTMAAIGTLVVVSLYLIAQMVGAGQLIKLLFGLNYEYAVIIVGVLMVMYVMFGGMLATTWVQIVKAVMLLAGATFMAVMVLASTGFSIETMFAKASAVKTEQAATIKVRAVTASEKAAVATAAHAPDAPELAKKAKQLNEDATKAAKVNVMAPGGFVSNPIDAISLGLALMFGTAGLPHILMRFFTVSDAKEARKSVLFATGFIGYFYILTFIIGFGAIMLVSTDASFKDAAGKLIGGNNMAAVHLARAVGGNLFFGFISAVAFATILAVVSGLTLSGASAVSHDLYAGVFRHGRVDEKQEIWVSKIATIVLGLVAIVLGILFENVNVAFMVGLAFSVAASANFPVILLSMYWKGLSTRGAVIGGFVGLISAVVLIVLGPAVWVDVLKHAKGTELFPYKNPAIFSMTLAFFTTWLFSVLDKSPSAQAERAMFLPQFVRSMTGIGAESASTEH